MAVETSLQAGLEITQHSLWNRSLCCSSWCMSLTPCSQEFICSTISDSPGQCWVWSIEIVLILVTAEELITSEQTVNNYGEMSVQNNTSFSTNSSETQGLEHWASTFFCPILKKMRRSTGEWRHHQIKQAVKREFNTTQSYQDRGFALWCQTAAHRWSPASGPGNRSHQWPSEQGLLQPP